MIEAELISIEYDQRKNIIVWICFKDDGVELPFYRGAELLIREGKKVWPLMATYQNFLGKTRPQILQWIKVNVEGQIGNIIKEKVKDQINSEIEGADLSQLIGQTISKDFVIIELDLDNDGVTETTVQLNSDGTYQVI